MRKVCDVGDKCGPSLYMKNEHVQSQTKDISAMWRVFSTCFFWYLDTTLNGKAWENRLAERDEVLDMLRGYRSSVMALRVRFDCEVFGLWRLLDSTRKRAKSTKKMTNQS